MRTPERDEDLLDVLLRLQREGGLQFALTNEIVSTVIFVRSAYLFIRLSSNPHNTFLSFSKTHTILSYSFLKVSNLVRSNERIFKIKQCVAGYIFCRE
jgi:hypothetical protein